MSDPNTDQQQKPQGGEQGSNSSPRTFTQEDLNRIVGERAGKTQRELQEARQQLEELTKRAAAWEEEKRAAEEAKLGEVERFKKTAEREQARLNKELEAASGTAKATRERLHKTLVSHEAASRTAPLAAKLFNPELARDVAAKASGAMSVEVDGRGNERVVIVVDGEPEPLTEEAWGRYVDKHLKGYLVTPGGAGTPAGRAQGSKNPLAGMRGADLYGAASAPKK